MDARELICGTGCAAFSTNERGVITGWNRGAEELLGFRASEALDKACADFLCGLDLFGNRFCHEDCAVLSMARKGEAIRSFQVDIPRKHGSPVRAGICTLVIRSGRSGEDRDEENFQLIHLLQPMTESPALHPGARGSISGLGERPEPRNPADVSLTGRELDVLRLLEKGVSTRRMAESLSISVTTVRNHVQGVLRKLGAHSRLEAVSTARRIGID